MTKLGTVTFTGRSGREYGFRTYTWKHGFKSLPAVYVVTERVVEPGAGGAPVFSPVYAGFTTDISRIFTSHEKSDCFQMYYANTIAVLPEADTSEGERIVRDLIQALDPPCNKEE